MENLVGHIIREVDLSDNGFNLIIKTESHKFIYRTEGDCCAHAYILELRPNDVADIIGHEVVSVIRNGFSKEDSSGYGQTDTEFISIQTHNGDLDLELRTEHNGYYSGWVNFVGKEPIWPIHDDIREEAMALLEATEQ